jgi:hypothetical protein
MTVEKERTMSDTKQRQSGESAKTTTGKTSGQTVSDTERERMIAEAAYFRAMNRGFQGGDPADDWLMAEREISRLLPGPKQQKAEQRAYERLRADLKTLLADAREVTAATVREALDTARTRLAEAGEYTAETVDKVAATIEKETAEAARKLGVKSKTLSWRAFDTFEAWRDRGQAFLASAAAATGDWIKQAGTRLERPVYHTGEMVASGTFECTACGEHIELATAAHLPWCGKCRGKEFRRL